MELAVKWVWQEVKHKGIPIEAGQKPALCFRRLKYMLAVCAGYPVRVLKRPVKDFDKCRDAMYEGKVYSVARAVEQLERIGDKNGITEKARKLLQRAKEGLNDIDEDEFQDEEGVSVEQPKDEAAAAAGAEGTKSEGDSTTQGKETDMAGKKKTTRKTGTRTKTVQLSATAVGEVVAFVTTQIEKEKKAHDGKLPKGMKRKIFNTAAEKFGTKRRVIRKAFNANKPKKAAAAPKKRAAKKK